MELPNISIPKALLEAIPTDQIPTLAHPPLVHFAIVLPIIIVLLELVNIIVKRGETAEEPKGRGVSTLSLLLIVAMVVIFALAYLAGSTDGKAAWDTLGKAGQSALKEHKLLGTYLVYASLALLVFKFIALMSGAKGRILFFILAIVFAGVTLKQGKEGGELVYQYGANVEAFQDCDDDKFDLNDEIESLKDQIAKKAEATPAVEKVKAQPALVATPVIEKAKVEPTPATEEKTEVKKEVATPEDTPVKEEEKSVVSQAEETIKEESKAVEASAPTQVETEVTNNTVVQEPKADTANEVSE